MEEKNGAMYRTLCLAIDRNQESVYESNKVGIRMHVTRAWEKTVECRDRFWASGERVRANRQMAEEPSKEAVSASAFKTVS